MDKLKKLGKYFTKGLQTGVLATALIAGNVSCSNSAGGDSIEFNGGNEGNGGNLGDGTQTSNWPSYYKTEEFFGQRFTETTTELGTDPNKDANFKTYYSDAKKFMDAELTELNKLVNNSNGVSTLNKQINTVLQDYSKASTIANNIDQNYTALASIFRVIEDSLDSQDFHRFNLSYLKLAVDAYNQSLGKYTGETGRFPANAEMLEGDSYIQNELNYTKLSYADAINHNNAKNRMNTYLNTVANQTNTDKEVLKKIVELALYNESLYGLNDHALVAQVNNQDLKSNKRELMTFLNKIEKASTTIIQSMNDHTM